MRAAALMPVPIMVLRCAASAALFAAAPKLLSLAVLCNAYLEPIADQLEICHKQPHEASALRQLFNDARAAIADAAPQTVAAHAHHA